MLLERSGGHFQEEVQAEEEEDNVGGPAGQEWRELADAAHGLQELGQQAAEKVLHCHSERSEESVFLQNAEEKADSSGKNCPRNDTLVVFQEPASVLSRK